MSARVRFLLAMIVLGLLMTGPFLATVTLLAVIFEPAESARALDLLLPRLPLGVLITAAGFVLGVVILRLLFRQYVHGLSGMVEQLKLMLGANRAYRVTPGGPPEIRELARAVNDLADQRDALLADIELQIETARDSVEEEKNRLAALMSELALGVVVCNLEGRILLYNQRARLEFKSLVRGNVAAGGAALIGLGRSIFTILERGKIDHALETVRHRLDHGAMAPAAHFITTSRAGQLLRVRMAPVLKGALDGAPPAAGPVPLAGFVLVVENVTREFERETRRDRMLGSLTEDNRAALGAVRAAVETLLDDPTMNEDTRQRFLEVIRDEATRMSCRLDDASHRFADALKTRWPLEEVQGADLVAAACQRIGERIGVRTEAESIDQRLWVRADSFSLLTALVSLAAWLAARRPGVRLSLRLSADGGLARFDILWDGPPLSPESLHEFEAEPMHGGGDDSSPLTLRDVLDRHGGEIWCQQDPDTPAALLRLVLPLVEMPDRHGEERAPAVELGSRPEYYDFNLFEFGDTSIDLDRPLAELTYTVFDTETTGLEPSSGDEIIQIGALRIVNGRLLRQENFEQLVDPRIPLKPASIPIHGITEDMLSGQPTIDMVLPAFHEFCSDTVLVAHNAAFDMQFLELKQASTGVAFSHPVLDTLLLSAVIHPNQESHHLEAIAERFGVGIVARHTALGDALVTGEVFLRMLVLLRDMGIDTLRKALDASQKTWYARVRY